MEGILGYLKSLVQYSLISLGLANKRGKLLFLGLDNAGKTTLLKKMIDGKLSAPKPTIHPNCGELAVGSLLLRTYDLGGHENARMLWDQYYTLVDGIVFLIDTQDDERFELAKEQLDDILKDDQLNDVPILLLGNKIDLPHSCSKRALISALGLEDILHDKSKGDRSRAIRLEMCSVVKGTGYGDGFRWLSETLQDKKKKHAMTIRSPTEKEIREVLPAGARGWESQTGEFDYWFNPDTDIEGAIPDQLRGTYLRNGPGVTEVYGTPLKHPIDGDGMIAKVSFTDKGVHFRNRFVKTESHMKEKEARRMLFPGQMGSKPPAEYDSQGKKKKKRLTYRDPSHTNVFYWGGKVISCHEYALPHSLDPHTLETIGRDTLGGTLDIKTLSAHYRYDADKDLIVLISFKPGIELLKTKPQIRLYEFDRSWKLHKKTKVSVPGLNYAHDFLLTPNWYIIHMTPFVNTSIKATMDIVKGKSSPGESFRYSPECPSKMVLVGRGNSNSGKIIEMETEPCHIYHYATAFEDPKSGDIVFDACCLPPGFTMDWQYKSFLANVGDYPGTMHQYTVTFNADKAELQRRQIATLSRHSCEFPFTNQYRHCVRTAVNKPRYFYMMAGREGVALPFANIVKYDYVSDTKTEWDSEGVIGEPVFIPRLGEAAAHHGNEDDGWLISQLYIPHKHQTQFVILDASNIENGPICRLKLHEHLPISFHGTFTHNIFTEPSPVVGDTSRL